MEYYNNYSEILCDTVSQNFNKETLQKSELIKKHDNSEFKHSKEKWTKIFSLNSHTLLCLSIQGETIELCIKHLFHNVSLKNYEALKERYLGGEKRVSHTKKYFDHSSDLIHEAVLQKIETGSAFSSSEEFSLYYCSQDFKNIYCVNFSVSDTELQIQEYRQVINENYSSVTSFTVSFDSCSKTNIFFFASEQCEGVLVSNPISFGRKETNEKVKFTHIVGQGNIISSSLSSIISGVTKRITKNERIQNSCIKIQ